MRSKGTIRTLVVVVVFALGLTGATQVFAAGVAGTKVTAKGRADVLNSPDQTVFVDASIQRDKGFFKGDHHVIVDHYNHRAQEEDRPEDSSYGHTLVTLPRVGTYGVWHYEVDDGRPCKTCGPIDTVCALLGDRC